MVMEINGKKDIQFVIKYSGCGDYLDFNTGEAIEVLLSMRCILDDEEVLEAYTKYDEGTERIRTFVKIEDQILELCGDMLGYIDVYVSSRLIGNPVKSQLSVETLNWCLDIA